MHDAHTHTWMHTHFSIYTHTHTHTHTWMYTHTHTHECVHTHTHTNMHVHVCAHTHMNTYTHTYYPQRSTVSGNVYGSWHCEDHSCVSDTSNWCEHRKLASGNAPWQWPGWWQRTLEQGLHISTSVLAVHHQTWSSSNQEALHTHTHTGTHACMNTHTYACTYLYSPHPLSEYIVGEIGISAIMPL